MSGKISTILILGARGDLAGRLLLPAVGQLMMMEPHRTLHLIGSGSREWSNDAWRQRVKESFDSATVTGDTADSVLKSTTYLRGDVTDPEDLQKLIDACQGAPAIYFALEKPFGTNEASAHALNQQLLKLVPRNKSTGSIISWVGPRC